MIDPKRFNKAAQKALNNVVREVAEVCDELVPRRTGKLADSQKVIITEGRGEISYSEEYALYVHEGYTRSNGNKVSPQPWMQEALRKTDIEGIVAKTFEDEF